MKNVTFFLLSFFIINFTFSQESPASKVVSSQINTMGKYLGQYNTLQSNYNIWIMSNNLKGKERIAFAEKSIAQIEEVLDDGIKEFKKFSKINNNFKFRDTCIYTFLTMKSIMKSNEAIEVLQYEDSKDVDELVSFYKSNKVFRAKSNKAIKLLQSYQVKLAKQYNVNLIKEDDKLKKKNQFVKYLNNLIEPASILNKYYQVIIDNVSNKEDSLAKINIISMKKYGLKVLPQLRKIGGFKGNDKLINLLIQNANYFSTTGYTEFVNVVKTSLFINSLKETDLQGDVYDRYEKAYDSRYASLKKVSSFYVKNFNDFKNTQGQMQSIYYK